MTINETLALVKAVKERVGELRTLRGQVSTRESWLGLDKNKVVEPQYDVKAVDRKVTELELWLFKADAAIKQSNATVQIALDSNVDKLLESLQ